VVFVLSIILRGLIKAPNLKPTDAHPVPFPPTATTSIIANENASNHRAQFNEKLPLDLGRGLFNVNQTLQQNHEYF